MALNIKDPEAERLATEVAGLTHETKTGAIRTALREKRDRLLATHPVRRSPEGLLRFLEEEIWPQIPPNMLGKALSKAEKEAILGYGPGGV
jgi:antitoxin VapB